MLTTATKTEVYVLPEGIASICCNYTATNCSRGAGDNYQVCRQPQHVRDALVFHRLIATPRFHKHADVGQGRVVVQRRYHKTVWELGHLKQRREMFKGKLQSNSYVHCFSRLSTTLSPV